MRRRIAAVLVHLYTASGAVLGFFAMIAVAGGDYGRAFLLLTIIMVIDYSDGTLARRVGVRRVLPWIDGELLDHVIDFFTNAVLPVYILWHSRTLPPPAPFWVVLILVTALYRFSKTIDRLESEGTFAGIPSAWIILAFYCVYLRPNAWLASAMILFLVALTLVPAGYLHLGRLARWRWINIVALVFWWVALLVVTQRLTGDPLPWVYGSLAQPAIYLVTSWVHGQEKSQTAATTSKAA